MHISNPKHLFRWRNHWVIRLNLQDVDRQVNGQLGMRTGGLWTELESQISICGRVILKCTCTNYNSTLWLKTKVKLMKMLLTWLTCSSWICTYCTPVTGSRIVRPAVVVDVVPSPNRALPETNVPAALGLFTPLVFRWVTPAVDGLAAGPFCFFCFASWMAL